MNRKLSSFESINAKDINKDLTYVSAVQKLSDGSYKNINIPLAQLSGLWNNDVQTAVANAEISGSSIDADVIHQAALNAVENALRDAKQSITEAVERANTFIGEVSSGNTATQQAIAEANERVLQEINAGLDRLGEINTLYGNYFGPGGVVEQALNDANNELAISKDLLRDAQTELEALANGEITSTGIKNLEEKVNGLVTLVGLEGQYVDPDGKFANRVYEALNLAMGNKTFMLKNINGEDQTVTTFDQLINAVNGIYTTTLSRVNALSGEVTNMRDEWDVEKGRMEESISRNNFSDPNNQTVKQAVRTMTADLIEQSVRKAVLDEIETITFLKTDPVGTVREITTPLTKETLYFLTWDKATDKDNPTLLEYQFVVLENGNEQPSNTAYRQLTTEGIRSSVILTNSQSQEQGEESEEENYTRKLYIRLATELEDDCTVSIAKQKYFSQSQISQTVDGVIISAVREELGKHNFSEFQVTDEYIEGVVARYNLNGNTQFSNLRQLADNINASVSTFNTNLNNKANKSEVDNSIEALQASIDVTDSKIDNTVSSYTCEIIDEWDESNYRKCIDDHQDESNNSIVYKSVNAINGTESAPNNVRCLLGLHLKNGQDIYLEHGHEYFLKIENISKIHYIVIPVGNTIPTIGNVQTDILENSLFTHSTDNSNRINDLKNDSILYFYYESKYNNKTHQRVGEPNIQLLESVSSKFANFEITADHIKEAISGQEETASGDGVINLIYQRLATAGGSTELIGEVGPGFLNQNQVVATATSVTRELMGLNNGESGNGQVTFVQESTFKQALDEIKSDVAKTQFTSINGVFKNASDSDYEQGPLYNGAHGVVGIESLTQNYFTGQLKNPKIENYDNQDYTIIMDNFDIFSIAEVSINGTVWFTKIPNTISNLLLSEIDERRILRPIHFNSNDEVKNLMLKYYRLDVQGKPLLQIGDVTNNYMPKFKIGYPTDVAVSNIKQTADGIKLQVSELLDNNYLTTSQFNIEKDGITSTVAAEVDGKLAGYSTIEQTKDFIASTVGAAGAVTNKFNDPLFKNGFGYWTKYPDAEIATIDSPYSGVYRKFISPLSTYYQITNLYYDWKIESNPSIVFYDNLNTLGSGNQIKNCGVYTRVKLQPKQKYTASFYIKLSKNHPFLKMNLGLTAELAMNAKTFCIAPWDVTKDPSYSPKLVKKTNVADWNDHASDELAYYEFDNFGSAGDISSSNKWCLSNDTTKPNDLKFGLWLDFYSGGLKNLVDELFKTDNSNPYTVAPGPSSFELDDFRWFKIWFTFTADDKYYKNGDVFKNDSLFGLTKLDETFDRAFCFEIASRGVAQNTYAQFYCEIAYPMLNSGTTPLKFSSQEKSNEIYSAISQTKDQIDLSINNVRQGLLKVGITIDAEDSERSTIKLKADVLEGDISNARFTGDVEAKSFKVQPQGINSSIELMIYNPNENKPIQNYITNFNNSQPLGSSNIIKANTPVLISIVGDDVYLINLTRLNSEGAITYYFKIRTDIPITTRNIGYSTASGDSISGFEIKPVKFFSKNVYKLYLDKYVAESIVETKEALITLNNVNSASFYTDLSCNNVKFNYDIFTSEDPKTAISRELGFGFDKPYIENTGVIKYSVNNVEKPIKDIAISNVTKSVNSINYFSVNSPVFERDSSEIISIFRRDTTVGSNGYLNNNLYVREVGKLKRFKVYKNINSSGSLINLQHINPNKPNEPSVNKYCYAVECIDSKTGKIFYQILGFSDIYYFGDLTKSDDSYGIVYKAGHADHDTCFQIAQYVINECFYIGCSIDKNLNENTLNGVYNTSTRIFFDRDECSKLEYRLQAGFATALNTASLSSSVYNRKIIVTG